MNTKISKEYRWEMGHRLPNHPSVCRNVHGHSYRMILTLEGLVQQNGILIDFYDIDETVKPIIENLDHSFLCDRDDTLMIELLENNKFKYNIVDFATTAENISLYFVSILKNKFKVYSHIERISVRVYETSDSYAETSSDFLG